MGRHSHYTLQREKTADLHQRASRWYAQANMATEAIQHALAADAYALAVDLLEHHAMEMIMQGYAQTVHGWVQAIPEEWWSQSPRTHLAFAWMHLLRGTYAQAAPFLERLQATVAIPQKDRQMDKEKASLKAEWLVMQSLLLTMQGQVTESLATATRALETVVQIEPAATHFTVQADQSGLVGLIRHLHGQGFVLLSLYREG